MRGKKNDMGDGDVCVWWGRRKKERPGGYMGSGKKIKKEKRNGKWGLRVWWEKRGSGKERRKKN